MTTPEGRVKNKLNRALRDRANKLYHFMPVQNGYGKASLDYLLCAGGKFIAIETKRDCNHYMTARQIATAGQINDGGGKFFLVYDDASMRVALSYIDGAIAEYERCHP